MIMLQQKTLLVEGHQVAYFDEGDGPPVLLIHGIPTSKFLWREVIPPELSRTHRVIAPDMLNYGASDKPARVDVSIAAQARLMVGVLDALGVSRADVVSHDIGGGIAQIMAVRWPQRVKKLVLSNAVCFDSWPIPEFIPLQKPEAEADMSVSAFEEMLRGFLPNGVYRPETLTQEAIDTIMEPWLGEAGKRALFRNLRRLNSEYTQAISDELEALEHDTLVLWGTQDPFQKPVYAEKLANTLPNARITWIEGAAHWIMEEKPQEVTSAIADFLPT